MGPVVTDLPGHTGMTGVGRMSQGPGQEWLAFYLRDHLAGATAGLNLFARVAAGHGHPQVRTRVGQLRAEIEQDRDALRQVMDALHIRQTSVTKVVAVIGEFAGRFKPNGALVRRSFGADVLELEALIAAVHSKAQLWDTLLTLPDGVPGLDIGQLQELCSRADGQKVVLRALHAEVVHQSPTA